MPSAILGARFELIRDQRQLLIEGRPAEIGRRAFDVLATLHEHRGHVVSRRQLRDAVWPGRVVEDANIDVQISNLRKLLGRESVVTVPGRGFHLRAEDSCSTDPSRAAAPAMDRHADLSIPRPPVELIGREKERSEIAHWLRKHRLVTITGAAGVGKSHLAADIGHAMGVDFPHGACLVPLASIEDPAAVIGEIAAALDARLPSADPLQGLARQLAGRRLLIVIDNAEHLLEQVASVVQVLSEQARGVRFLVTSQARLHLSWEAVWRLGGLAYPDAGADADADTLRAFSAVALFERVLESRGEARADDAQTLRVVGQICRRLDGLPLAIRMAAARCRMLGASGLAELLDSRLQVLRQVDRTPLARHVSLRAALEWSYGLLKPDEQIVFRRLAVLRGGGDLDLTLRVLHDERMEDWQAIDALDELAQRAILEVVGDPPRYALMESARCLAAELLAASGEEEELQALHARAVADRFAAMWFEEVRTGRVTTEEREAACLADLDNARAAFAWSVRHDAERAVGLCMVMSPVVAQFGAAEVDAMWRAARPLLDEVPLEVRAYGYLKYGDRNFYRDSRVAKECVTRALEWLHQLGDANGEGDAWGSLVMMTYPHVEPEQVEGMRRCKPAVTNKRILAFIEEREAAVELFYGRPDRARDHLYRSMELARAAGNRAAWLRACTEVDSSMLPGGHAEVAALNRRLLLEETRPSEWRLRPSILMNMMFALVQAGTTEGIHEFVDEAWMKTRAIGTLKLLVDLLARAATLEQRFADGAQLLGFSDEHCRRENWTRLPNQDLLVRDIVASASAALGQQRFEQLRAAGQELTEEMACRLAGCRKLDWL